MGHSLQVPLSPWAPQSPRGALTWAPGARVSRQGFHQPQAPASLGECNEEKHLGPGSRGEAGRCDQLLTPCLWRKSKG